MKTAYGYCRDSGGPTQDRSVRDQRAALEAWADANGYTITRWYEDVARTGKNEDRDEFQRMITDALREKPTAVAMWDAKRWARNQDAAAYYRALLRRAGVEVVSLNDPIPDGPMGRIVESVIDFSSEHFLATLRVDVKRGQRALLAQGFAHGGRQPLGYQAERVALGLNARTGQPRYGTRWVIDAELAPLIRRAFELRATGASLRSVMTQTGLCRTTTSMSALLRNQVYKGVYRYGAEEWLNVAPAIIDADLWQRAQVGQAVHPRTAGANHLLTGLLICDTCGYGMTGMNTRTRGRGGRVRTNRYYTCNKRVVHVDSCGARLARADDLEADVIRSVFETILAPEPFALFVAAAEAAEQVDVTQNRAAKLDQDIVEAERTLRDLVDLLDRGVAVAVVAEKLRAQEEAARALRRARAELPETRRVFRLTRAELAAYAADLAAKLETGNIETKRWVLRQVIEEIRCGERIRITYKLPTV